MTTAVVMGTYNGAKYIVEQLNSLREQTRKIDEVLIFDDGSTDGTQELICNYISKYNLSNWHFFENENNLGCNRNFYEGIIKASADIIFPCDQDDIWYKYKIELMTNIMENNKNIDVLEGGYDEWFVTEKNIKRNFWSKFALFLDKINEKTKFHSKENIIMKRKLNSSLMKLAPACIMCIRKNFFDEIKDLWIPEFSHDAFVTFLSQIKSSYYILYTPVIKRRHLSSSVSHSKIRSRNVRIKEINRDEKALEVMQIYADNIECNDRKIKKIFNNATKWNRIRKSFLSTKNPLLGIYLLFYIRYYERFRTYVTDWLYTYLKQ